MMNIKINTIYAKPNVEGEAYNVLLSQCVKLSSLYEEVAKSYSHFATARNQIMPPKTIAGFCMNGGIAVVAEVENRFVGSVLLFPHGGRGYELMIGVSPTCQGQKIGSTLMEKTIEVLKTIQARNVCLMVTADNDKAISLYHKYGFVQVGQTKRNYFDEQDPVIVWMMERRITGTISKEE